MLTPCLNVVDVLPDCIGCLLIGRGLSRLRFLSDRMSQARDALTRLLTVSCSKWAGLLVVALFRDETTTLLITFLFTVLELLFTTPVLRELTEGAEELGIRYECKAAAEGAATVRILFTVFLWVRCLGALVPEMLCLWDPLYTGEFTADYLLVSEALGRAKILLTVLQLLGVSAFAAVVGVSARRLFLTMEHDKAFCHRLEKVYRERYGSDPGFLRRLRLDKALVWLLAAALLGLRLYMNRLNYLPDFLFFLALYAVRRNAEGRRSVGKRLWVCLILSSFCFALRSYGAVVFYPYFGERWQALWLVYPAGVISAATLVLGLFWLVDWLDECSQGVYGRRRVKTVGLKIAAVLTGVCALVDYALPSLFDFLRRVNADFPLAAKNTTELWNIAFTWVGVFVYAFFVFRVWVLSSAMRQDLKLETKL